MTVKVYFNRFMQQAQASIESNAFMSIHFRRNDGTCGCGTIPFSTIVGSSGSCGSHEIKES
jgi:hypothetical protein